METLPQFLNRIRSRPTEVRTYVEIPPANQITNIGNDAILPNEHYFAVVVDEMFLHDARQWYQTFDPMVFSVTSYTYDRETIELPFTIGSRLLGEYSKNVPEGMLYRETLVAGIHPYRGGKVASTMILCQVRRGDLIKKLLNVVESVSRAVPFAAELGTYSRYAGAIKEGMEAVLGSQETTPLTGIRREFNHDLATGIRNTYFALIDAAEGRFPAQQLWVNDGSLLFGPDESHLVPFRAASYVLFSYRGVAKISDLSKLPFATTAANAVKLASKPSGESWKQAKAELAVLAGQLLTSPDLTEAQADEFLDMVTDKMKKARKKAITIKALSPRVTPQDRIVARCSVLLDLEPD